MGFELFDWYGAPAVDEPRWPPDPEVQGPLGERTLEWVRRLTTAPVRALKLSGGRPALVLGRFDPPHLGHALLIEAARSAAPQPVVVRVFSRRGDLLSGSVRVAALNAMVPFAALETRVVEVDEDFPTGAPDVARWVAWFKSTDLPGRVGRLFTSDSTAEAFASAAGLELVLVDPARRTFPISSSMIRADPWAAWDALVPELHPRMARLVGIIGPEGGGKTTVARALGTRFETVVGHEYLERLAGAGPLTANTLRAEGLSGARATMERVRARARRFGIVDSDPVNLRLWHERLFPAERPLELLPTDWCHHYLVFDDHPWTGDPEKDQPEARRRMVHDAVKLLEANGRSFALISGPREGRLAQAIAAIDEWAKTKPALR